MSITPERIAELRALAERVKLPWFAGDCTAEVHFADQGTIFAKCASGEPIVIWQHNPNLESANESAYIVAAANALPALLDEVERLRSSQSAECHWRMEDSEIDVWDSDCEVTWMLNTGAPKMNFCPECGRKLIVDEPEKLRDTGGGEG